MNLTGIYVKPSSLRRASVSFLFHNSSRAGRVNGSNPAFSCWQGDLKYLFPVSACCSYLFGIISDHQRSFRYQKCPAKGIPQFPLGHATSDVIKSERTTALKRPANVELWGQQNMKLLDCCSLTLSRARAEYGNHIIKRGGERVLYGLEVFPGVLSARGLQIVGKTLHAWRLMHTWNKQTFINSLILISADVISEVPGVLNPLFEHVPCLLFSLCIRPL